MRSLLIGFLMLLAFAYLISDNIANTKAIDAYSVREVKASVDPVNAMVLPAPAHLDILSAGIQELPPIEIDNVGSRHLIFRVEVAGSPNCDAATPFLAYGFLLDADKDIATGVAISPFASLGVDARVSAECDSNKSTFVSPMGPVTVTTDTGSGVTVIEILTTAGLLPSVDLDWIAFAQSSTQFLRLPNAPDHSAWAPHERVLY